jgi:hypothetical protein
LSEKFRRFVILVPIRSGWIHLSTLSEFAGPLQSWGADFFNHLGKHVATFQGLPPNIHGAIVDNYFKGALVNDLSDTDFTALTTPWKTNEGTMSFYSQFAQANEKYTAEVEPVFGANRYPVQVVSGGT